MSQPLPESETSLPQSFKPSNNHVIIGRGKKTYNHPGNVIFRSFIQSRLAEYSQAKTKTAKSLILVDTIRQVHANGGFVKIDPVTGQWMTAGTFLAREKVSQTFRDILSDGYKSSKASKKKRRQEQLVSSCSSMEVESMTTAQQAAGKRRRLDNDDLEPKMIIAYSKSSREDQLEEIDTSSLESLLGEEDYDIDQVFGFSTASEDDNNLDNVFDTTDALGVPSKANLTVKFDFSKGSSVMSKDLIETDFKGGKHTAEQFQPERNISSARTA